MSNIIIHLICCIDYCFAFVIHRLGGEDKEVEEEDKEVEGMGKRRKEQFHVTVVKYYGKNEQYNCIVYLYIFNVIM